MQYIYIYGTLQIHHLERVSQSEITFYYNSPYKQLAQKLRSVNYAIAATTNLDCDTDSEEIDELVYENLNTEANIGDIVLVEYQLRKTFLKYLGLVQDITDGCYTVQFLKRSGEKTFTIKIGDKDNVTRENIRNIIQEGQFSVNIRGQYIIDEPLIAADLAT